MSVVIGILASVAEWFLSKLFVILGQDVKVWEDESAAAAKALADAEALAKAKTQKEKEDAANAINHDTFGSGDLP